MDQALQSSLIQNTPKSHSQRDPKWIVMFLLSSGDVCMGDVVLFRQKVYEK